jgi:16S rRNA (guanine1207-N2)-methyltransferase
VSVERNAQPPTIRTTIHGVDLELETAPSLFAPRAIDPGTLAMLSRVSFSRHDKILDLGCGYGVIGILAAKLLGAGRVHMIDNDPVAIEMSRRNARSNGVEGVNIVLSDGVDALAASEFTQILCNPPYHVDFSVPKRFIHKGFNRLVVGGRFWLVTQRDDWYRNKLRSIFGRVTVHPSGPYRVLEAVKRSSRYANAA